MKKSLFFIAMMGALLPFNAQTVIFEETFESSVINEIPSGWETIARGGIFSWLVDEDPSYNTMGFSGKTVAMLSLNSSTDQLLVSPAINLPVGNSFSLSFLIGKDTLGGILNSDIHYAVYVLPVADVFTGSETAILEEDISTADAAESKTIDVSGYAGQSVKIYFRLFNSTNNLTRLVLDTIQLTQQPQLSTLETNLQPELTVYPNPASDYIYLKSKFKITKAEIYDMAGRKLNVKLENERLDVRDLAPGTYMITTESENKKSTHKLIKK